MPLKKKIAEHKWNILIAEDNLPERAELLKGLSPMAHCTTVQDGQEAIDIYHKFLKKKRPFDFILLDVMMPKISGFDVLKTIRDYEESQSSSLNQNARIIMITGYRDSLLENYNMGWDDYISKPIDIDKLLKKMHSMMEIP
jgi:CheY-like chemotaxis protein